MRWQARGSTTRVPKLLESQIPPVCPEMGIPPLFYGRIPWPLNWFTLWFYQPHNELERSTMLLMGQLFQGPFSSSQTVSLPEGNTPIPRYSTVPKVVDFPWFSPLFSMAFSKIPIFADWFRGTLRPALQEKNGEALEDSDSVGFAGLTRPGKHTKSYWKWPNRNSW